MTLFIFELMNLRRSHQHEGGFRICFQLMDSSDRVPASIVDATIDRMLFTDNQYSRHIRTHLSYFITHHPISIYQKNARMHVTNI